jgi:hypothetical protein
MDGGNEQRVAITFCFKAGLSATETILLVQTSYGNKVLNRSNVFRWYSRFRNGGKLVEDDERSGCPKSTRTEVNISDVADLAKWQSNRIKNDSRIFEQPQVCSSSGSKIGFGKEKFVCRFCFTILGNWAKGRWSHILTRHYRNGRCRQKCFNKIVTRDETWCFAYDPATRRQRSVGVGETSPRPKKLKF